jgi:hypothetical protein
MKILLLLAAVLMVAPADAQIANRQARQQGRIAEGKASGELTKEEAAKLNRKAAATRRQTRRDRVDGGGLSAAERAKANRKLNSQSKEIYKEKHDGDKKQ